MINLTYRYVAWGHGGAVIVGDDPDDPASTLLPAPGRSGPSAGSPPPPEP
jgi:hypothetical protein